MTAHDHTERVEGCYRCELGRDEAESAMQEEIADLEADIDRLVGAINDYRCVFLKGTEATPSEIVKARNRLWSAIEEL